MNKNIYEQYGLSDNPFKLEYDHEVVGKSQNETFDKILHLFSLNSAYKNRSGNRFIAVLKGEYGYGKSFFHIKLHDSILHKDSRFKKQIDDDIKIAVSFFHILTPDKRLPPKVMLHLYKSIVDNLGRNGEEFFYGLYTALEKMAKAQHKKVEDLISGLDRNFQRAILNLNSSNPGQYTAWKWISGEKLNKKELDSLSLQFSINTPELAERYIFQLLKLLKILDYGLLVVLIDELEQVMTIINEKQFWRTLVVIQDIFDKYAGIQYSVLTPMTPIGFLGGLTEEAWLSVERGAEEEKGVQAVRSRIHENVFEFEKFNLDDTRQFIAMLLKKKRVDSFRGDSLVPFTKDSVETISEFADGNPREIINKCQKLLELAIAKKAPKIDIDLTNQYFEGIGAGDISEGDAGEGEIGSLEEEEKI